MEQNLQKNGSHEENSHIITSESSDSNHKKPSPAVVVESEEISLQEQKQLAGLNNSFSDESSNGLISKQYQYYSQSEPEQRDIAESALPRTILVVGTVGVFVLSGLFMFVGFGGSGSKKVVNQVEQNEQAEVPKESDMDKARLAVVGQKEDQQKATEDAFPRAAQLEQTSKEEPPTPKRKDQISTRQRALRPERLEPRRTRTLRRPQPQLIPPARKSPAPQLVVYPLERWNLLATAGSQQSSAVVAAENSQNGLTFPRQPPAELPDTDRQVSDTALAETPAEPPDTDRQVSDDSDRQASDTALSETQGYTADSDRQALDTGRISRVVIGNQPPVVNNTNPNTSGSQGIVVAQAGQLPITQTNANISGDIANSGVANGGGTTLTPGAQGIISRQQQFTTTNQPIIQTSFEVPIGSTASARLKVPIIWSEDGWSPTAGRFAVTLTEPLIAKNGEVALPKDTVLITQVTQITPDSHLVYQSAVAIVYRDRTGQIRQQEIPPNNIIVRGDRGQPLIAESLGNSSRGALKQDLLLGALSSLGKIGEVINRPDEEIIREDGGFDSYRRERRTNSGESDILAAALEGFFEATADRVGKRAERSVQQQLASKPLLVVPEGKKATVYVNSFLEVRR